MTEVTAKKRNVLVLVLAGLVLGTVPIMLWLGRWKLAVVYFFAGIIVITLFFLLPILGLTDPVSIEGLDLTELLGLATLPISIVGIFHAIRLNREPSDDHWYMKWYVALIVPSALAFLLALIVRTFLLQPFNSPSGSNEPTLMVGDYFFVSKTAYSGEVNPQRGDIAVFKLTTNTDINYVKRVVGVPGDHIQMISSTLNINGKPVKLERLQLAPEFYDAEPIIYFRETLPNGRSYVIANMRDDGGADNTIEYVVPANHYFVMGDNRDNSDDSRFLDHVGYIPEENFVGRIVFRFWNSKGFSLVNRPEETYPKR
jgi:signal peptidase I